MSLFPHLHTPFPLLPVPNKPYVFCGLKHQVYLLAFPRASSQLIYAAVVDAGSVGHYSTTPGREWVNVEAARCFIWSRVSDDGNEGGAAALMMVFRRKRGEKALRHGIVAEANCFSLGP